MNTITSFFQQISQYPLPPYAYDVGALLFILFTSFVGYKKGLIRQASSLIALVLAYPLSNPVGSILMYFLPQGTVPLLLTTPARITLGGLGAYFALSTLFWIVIHACKLHSKKWEGNMLYIIRGGGMLIGAIFGIGLIFIVSWYLLWAGSLTNVFIENIAEKVEKEPEDVQAQELLLRGNAVIEHEKMLQMSFIGTVSKKVQPFQQETIQIEAALRTIQSITGDPVRLKEILESPTIQQIMDVPSIQSVLEDEEVRSLAEDGDLMGLLQNEKMLSALNDPEVQAKMTELDTTALLQLLAGDGQEEDLLNALGTIDPSFEEEATTLLGQ